MKSEFVRSFHVVFKPLGATASQSIRRTSSLRQKENRLRSNDPQPVPLGYAKQGITA